MNPVFHWQGFGDRVITCDVKEILQSKVGNIGYYISKHIVI